MQASLPSALLDELERAEKCFSEAPKVAARSCPSIHALVHANRPQWAHSVT